MNIKFANANDVFYICNVKLKQINDILLKYCRKYTKNKMKKLQKGKGLTDMLRALKIGETVDIQPAAYKVNYVQTACRRLKAEGKEYKCTEKGLITGCHVTRLR